jgi:hypothetical protein
MKFRSPLWLPVAMVLSAVNLVAVGVAAGTAEPWHAAGHAALALGFGLWAERRRQSGRLGDGQTEVLEALDAIEADVSKLREDLTETQERLDFTERLLAREAEIRRVDPAR